MQFRSDIEKWIKEEKKQLKVSSGSVPDVFDSDEFDDTFSDVVSSTPEAESHLDRIKNQVMSSIDPDTIIALSVQSMENKIDEARAKALNLTEKQSALQYAFKNIPTYYEEKKSIDKTIDLYSQFSNSKGKVESTANAREKLLSILDANSVDQFLSDKSFFSTERVESIQKVKELRERYYTVNASEKVNISITEYSPIKFVDKETGDDIQDIEGFDTAEVDENGDIRLTTEEGYDRTIEVQPTETPKRSGGFETDIRYQMIEESDALKEEFRYEAWACLVLNTAEWIFSAWQEIKSDIEEAAAMLNVAQKMLDRGATTQTLGFKGMKDLLAIKKSAFDLIDIEDFKVTILGVKNNLKSRQSSFNQVKNPTICDFNKNKYCNISKSLEGFLVSINGIKDPFPADLNGELSFDLSDIVVPLAEFYSKVFDLIGRADEQVNLLKPHICSFINKKMIGTPKSLNASSVIISNLIQLLLLMPKFQLESAIDQASISKRLRKSGYDVAADSLSRGDVSKFLETTERNSTLAGRVAENLRQKSEESRNPAVAQRYRQLMRSARAYGDQKVLGQKIRENIRSRISRNRGLATAESIEAEEKVLRDD